MYEIDKTAFADFLAMLRKEKGYTQKELAEKLFVSDKAVSKWERGLSMPDISLLMFTFYYLNKNGWEMFSAFSLLPVLLSFIFGLYFWFLVKERLPAYYDENKINIYSDGFFRLCIPGVSFNNKNWPRVLKIGRICTAALMVIIPLLCFSFSGLPFTGSFRSGIRIGYVEHGTRSDWNAQYHYLNGAMKKNAISVRRIFLSD